MPNTEQLSQQLTEILDLLAEYRAKIDELARPDLPQELRTPLLRETDLVGDRLTVLVNFVAMQETSEPIENLPPLEFDN